ncbi:MAG: alpha/beta hydrolase [Anaerolineales bacterium]
MKFKKTVKYLGIGLAALLVVAVLGLFAWSKTSTYPARDVALAALESGDGVAVSQDQWITFTPEEGADIGLIFYPGGLVEPAAYAPVLRQIAAQEVLVVITPMPLNLAIFNTGAADAVIQAHPEISTWILAGHSLGGAAASIYAESNPDRIAGLALWDSYPPDSSDLSDNDLPVLSIYGTTDGIPNTDNFDAKRDLLPASTEFAALEGASHAQFGDYGPQKGDVLPTLSLADQHQRVTEIMLDFIEQQ